MKNGHICYPLTVSDNYSRFLLGCKALEGPRYEPTRKCMESIFREYGLPDAIRSDNGIPFAGKSIGGLSRLMIWWILLGIFLNGSERDVRKRMAGMNACIGL